VISGRLTIVVVLYNSMKVFPEFIENLNRSFAGEHYPIIICDNGSRDGVEKYIQNNCPYVKFLKRSENEGYGAALNRGIYAAETTYVALMNPDIYIQPGGLDNLIHFLDNQPEAAAVTGVLSHSDKFHDDLSFNNIFPDKLIPVHFAYESLKTRALYYSGLSTKFRKYKSLLSWKMVTSCDLISVSRINGAFGVFRKKALVEVKGFDPRFFLYFEEDDIAISMIKKGYKLFVTDRVIVLHRPGTGSESSRSLNIQKVLLNSQYMFFAKHYGIKYAWYSFFCIWLILSLLLIYQTMFGRTNKKLIVSLCKWHFESFMKGGKVPSGTIPEGGKKGVNYDWACIFNNS